MAVPGDRTVAFLGEPIALANRLSRGYGDGQRRRDTGLGYSLLHDLLALEALRVRIPSYRMRRGLAPKKPRERVACLLRAPNGCRLPLEYSLGIMPT